ncbi:MAG TPA: ATP-dependent DNA helicase RecG [Candidatus Saccharimonadales bacterium]
MEFSAELSLVRGVGPKLAERFKTLGVETIHDLLYFFPRRYDNYGNVVFCANVQPGNVTVCGRILEINNRFVRRGLHITEARLADDSGELRAVWFNQPYRAQQLKSNKLFYFTGSYELQRNRYLLMNPATEQADLVDRNGPLILPIYRETKGLSSLQIRKIMAVVLPLTSTLPETLPAELLKKQRLMHLGDALRFIHAPVDEKQLEHAKKRLAFEELLAVMLAAIINKNENARLHAWHIPFDETAAKKFVKQLPFTLTNAQRKAAWEIVKNFEAGTPMNRLLQGDVGAGKTVVAAMAAYLAAQAGYQTAFMAPTELLAQQHAATLYTLLAPYGLTVGILTSSVKGKSRETLLENIQAGAIAVTVGTHALIQPAVKFHTLGFVVIDEQHRFGVEQRRSLLDKGERMPHLLSMSATPIPRSLALTVYGELDISMLDELPAGRLPIRTEIISPNSRSAAYEKVNGELEAGQQAYIICPQIEPSDKAGEKSVEQAFRKLSAGIFKQRSVAMLHGKLKPEDKEAIMRAFKNGEIDVLVSTTVIEVGVDVPNATVMLIESADTFGLAQLHQLRGRVGRSSLQSYCYLVTSTSQKPSRRLRELERSTDGFYLAEVDLELRGPGEVYGRSQHGALDMRLARLGDTKLTKKVREAAAWLLSENIEIKKYPKLHARVERMRRVITLN